AAPSTTAAASSFPTPLAPPSPQPSFPLPLIRIILRLINTTNSPPPTELSSRLSRVPLVRFFTLVLGLLFPVLSSRPQRPELSLPRRFVACRAAEWRDRGTISTHQSSPGFTLLNSCTLKLLHSSTSSPLPAFTPTRPGRPFCDLRVSFFVLLNRDSLSSRAKRGICFFPEFIFAGSWVCLFLFCHPHRSGPIFSSAPICGASGRGVEGSWHPLNRFSHHKVLLLNSYTHSPLLQLFSSNIWDHNPMPDPHRIVILGGGFGGLVAARTLKRTHAQITLIDKRNFHLFQPLLYQVATGSLSPGEIAAPLRSVLSRQRNTQV